MEVVSYLIRCLCCGCHALGLSSLTSLFMYPSLLMSYKLNVHLSFSWTVPLSKIDRAVTKSWEGEEAWVTLTTKPSGGGSSVFGSNPVTAYTEWHHSCSLSPERYGQALCTVAPLFIPYSAPFFGRSLLRKNGALCVLTPAEAGKCSLLWYCLIPWLQFLWQWWFSPVAKNVDSRNILSSNPSFRAF